MREIKFRAWDKILKTIFTPEEMETEELKTGLSYGKPFVSIQKRNGDWDELTLMQYTGLKDRNGKEIYEGDVMQCKIWGDKLNGTAIVKFDDGSFYLDYYHNEDNFPEDFIDKFYKFEIIGNIYENPELLNEK